MFSWFPKLAPKSVVSFLLFFCVFVSFLVLNDTQKKAYDPQTILNHLIEKSQVMAIPKWSLKWLDCPEAFQTWEDCTGLESTLKEVELPNPGALSHHLTLLPSAPTHVWLMSKLKVMDSIPLVKDEFFSIVIPRNVHNKTSFFTSHQTQDSFGMQTSSIFNFSPKEISPDGSINLVIDIQNLPWFGPADLPIYLTTVDSAHEIASLPTKLVAGAGLTQQLFVGIPLVIVAVAMVIDTSILMYYLAHLCAAIAVRSVLLLLYGLNIIPHNDLVQILFVLIHTLCFYYQSLFSLCLLKKVAEKKFLKPTLFGLSLSIVLFITYYFKFWNHIDNWIDSISSLFSLVCFSILLVYRFQNQKPKQSQTESMEERFITLDRFLFLARNCIIILVLIFNIQVNLEDIIAVQSGGTKTPLDWRHWAFLPGMLLTALVEVGSITHKISQTAKELTKKALLDKDLAVGKDFQLRLLPSKRSSTNAFEWRALYVPASSLAGDWFDVREIHASKGKILIASIVADVTGHGTGPALCTAIIAASWNRWCNELQKCDELGETQMRQKISEALVLIHESLLIGRLQGTGTAALLLIDTQTQMAIYATAGHPSILVASPNEVRILSTRGTMLGLPIEEPTWETGKVQISHTETVFLYSDGCWPPKDPHSLWLQRLKRQFQKMPFSLELSLVKQMRKTKAFYRLDPESEDDMTLLMLKLREPKEEENGDTLLGQSL